MEELCAALPYDSATEVEEEDSASETSEAETEQVHSLSTAAVTGTMNKKTMRLLGFVDQQQMLILVDSRSSANFISSAMVQMLGCTVTSAPVVQVTIANGTKMTSDKQISHFKWGCQNVQFTTPVRVLDLPCYDMILGMEWLTTFSPMWVDWKIKKMKINVDGK